MIYIAPTPENPEISFISTDENRLQRINLQAINRTRPEGEGSFSSDKLFDLSFRYEGIPGPVPPGGTVGNMNGISFTLLPRTFTGSGIQAVYYRLTGRIIPEDEIPTVLEVFSIFKTDVVFDSLTTNITIEASSVIANGSDFSRLEGVSDMRITWDGAEVNFTVSDPNPNFPDAAPDGLPGATITAPFVGNAVPGDNDIWIGFLARVFNPNSQTLGGFFPNGTGSITKITNLRYRQRRSFRRSERLEDLDLTEFERSFGVRPN